MAMAASITQLLPGARPASIAARGAIGYGRPSAMRARFSLVSGEGESAGSMCVARADGPEGIRHDQVLMASIAAGDQGAFATLVGQESARLLRFARSMLTASPAEAEEVVQEALLRLWQQAPDWEPNGRVSTWLHQVAYRLCIDNIRRRRPSVEIETVEEAIPDDGTGADQRLIRIDEVTAVRAAIERLPERQKTALLLCHFQDMSQAEASAVMGIGESAYESLLARARRRLRGLIEGGEPAENEGGAS
jgi:RNA polymerase sigma-70 factor (ECF subfamily)